MSSAACRLKLGQAPPARAEAIVISDLTPDPTGSPHWVIAIGSGLKGGTKLSK